MQEKFWKSLSELSLGYRLILALISGLAYWPCEDLSDWVDGNDTATVIGTVIRLVFGYLPGFIFGVLVMAPYAAASRNRVMRAAGLGVASSVIYYLAMKFVVDGPFSYETMTPFLISGGGSALLVGFAVLFLAPIGFRWILIPLTLVAGLFGGAAFRLNIWGGIFQTSLLPGHIAWQILVCLALHFGLPLPTASRGTPATKPAHPATAY